MTAGRTVKFAHFADTHLGFQKAPRMQEIEAAVFHDAIGQCISEKVDFTIWCGDTFHTNIPAMSVQKTALTGFRRLTEAGIPAYTIYGSHDFSPVSNSFIDLLVEIGYMTKLTYSSNDDGSIVPNITVHEPTGAALAGLPGLKSGRDRELYERLERAAPPDAPARIFLFHGAITEISAAPGESMAASLLPAGWDYYAGGHMHDYMVRHVVDYNPIVYPGTVLAGYHADMENTARGTRRGFALAEVKDGNATVEMRAVDGCKHHHIQIDVAGRAAPDVDAELQQAAADGFADTAVILRLSGELSEGRITAIDVGSAKARILSDGALCVEVHAADLLGPGEAAGRGNSGPDAATIERQTFLDATAASRTGRDELDGEGGAATAMSLLEALRQGKAENATKSEYQSRMVSEAYARMGVEQ